MRTSSASFIVILVAAAAVTGCGGGGSGGGTGVDGGEDASMDASTDAGPHDGGPQPGSDGSVDAGDAAVQDAAEAGLPPVTKMDVLFVIDNSSSMADKQSILALAMPELLNGLLNPACVDASGTPVASAQQPSPTGACPSGTHRQFRPIADAHVGFISSSLGSFGADACPGTTTCPNGATNTSEDDQAHLLTRTDPCAAGQVPTYQSEGFLAWDPNGQLSPPGESVLGDGTAPGLVQSANQLLLGAGALGCAFESQNEAWYRFLVDPAPYATITLNGQNAVTSGVDQALLTQRGQFLRPDSLLVIVQVTDKTDASLKQYGVYPIFAQLVENNLPFHLPHASSDCTSIGPAAPCCYSCGQPAPTGCTADPACTSSPAYTAADENVAIRSFGLTSGIQSQKARYGIEFFYAPSRYVGALTSATIQNQQGQTVPNPIFAGGQRDPSRVLYAAIVGVPWQLVARQDADGGAPDLVGGVDPLDPTQVGGFKTPAELSLKDPQGNTFWSDIAGDPETYVSALSPFMQESTTPRTGTDPITGIAISPVTSPAGTNPINGHEWTISTPPGDTQYACVFAKQTPVDCSAPGTVCDCSSTSTTNPLCAPNPNDSNNPTLQIDDKAYPGLKHLAIARGLGAQAVVGSICAKQLTSSTAPDYGYAPTARAIVTRVGAAIQGP